MSLWIKICGVTNPDAIEAAAESGADAIGFVIAPSPRRLSPEQARALSVRAPDGLERVIVMKHPPPAIAEQTLRQCPADYLQTEWSDFLAIRLPDGCRALPVLREDTDFSFHELPECFLYEGAHSGIGHAVDLDRAREVCQAGRVVLAGGLNPDNVADAIRRARPYGVDVSSGVESDRGVKDPVMIRDFVQAARAVAAEIFGADEVRQ